MRNETKQRMSVVILVAVLFVMGYGIVTMVGDAIDATRDVVLYR